MDEFKAILILPVIFMVFGVAGWGLVSLISYMFTALPPMVAAIGGLGVVGLAAGVLISCGGD